MISGNSKDHLVFFLNKIKNNEHFGLIRPADGEYAVLRNTTLTNCDNWTFNKGGLLCEQLLNSLSKYTPNLYMGIPCPCCSKEILNYYLEINRVPNNQLTYANIFCNANWYDFMNFLKMYSNGFSLVTGGKLKPSDFPINDLYNIDPLLVNSWDNLHEQETANLLNWLSNKTNELICFSAGPLSKIWIPIAMEKYPNNTYIDIGSSLDLYTKGITNRPYTIDGHYYNRLVCNFNL